jgi:hypothetical protein
MLDMSHSAILINFLPSIMFVLGSPEIVSKFHRPLTFSEVLRKIFMSAPGDGGRNNLRNSGNSFHVHVTDRQKRPHYIQLQ